MSTQRSPRQPRQEVRTLNVGRETTSEDTKPTVDMRRIREMDKPVRIRAAADISSAHVDGKYLGKKWRTIDQIVDGPGAKHGWGHLYDGEGWVNLDFVEVMGIDLAAPMP